MRKNTFSPALVSKVRNIPILLLLTRLQERNIFYFRRDETYSPVKNGGSVRLHVSSPGGNSWELVVTSDKWFDSRSRTGGGGCIDLLMFLSDGISFKKAVSLIVSVSSDE